MSIIIRRIADGKESNPDSKSELIALHKEYITLDPDESYEPNWAQLCRAEGEWFINVGYDQYVYEPCSLKPEEFEIIDTDYIKKFEISKILNAEYCAPAINEQRYFARNRLIKNIANRLGISLIENK